MKEAELKVDLAVMGDEVIGTIRMTGPLYCHVEFAAALIREISKDSGESACTPCYAAFLKGRT